jgi:hypothetical protein
VRAVIAELSRLGSHRTRLEHELAGFGDDHEVEDHEGNVLMNHSEKYTYQVQWSEEGGEFVGLCAEFPGLSWIARTNDEAFVGIKRIVRDVVVDMVRNKEALPTPIGMRGFAIALIEPAFSRASGALRPRTPRSVRSSGPPTSSRDLPRENPPGQRGGGAFSAMIHESVGRVVRASARKRPSPWRSR